MMKRALIISAIAHLAVLLLLWQVSLSLSRPVARGYPRLITATLVTKPAEAPGPPALAPPAATVSQPVLAPAPELKPVEKKSEPAKPPPKDKPEKTPPTVKQQPAKPNVSPISGSANSSGGRGSATTTPSAGGGGNSLKLDVSDFPFSDYIARIQFRIENNWEAPFSGQGERLATVHFKIMRSGEIVDIKLEQSSGNVLFDQAAQRAVYDSNPLPPLPAGFSSETLGVHFDFVAY